MLADHRRELGTRAGTRALTCWKQAVIALAWFRDRPDVRKLGGGSGISQATAYRYKDEAAELPAVKAPTLRETLGKAAEQGLPYLILDGTLVSSDRCADKKTSKKGKEIDQWYSGKAHEPAGNVRALAAPGGVPLWVSDVLPGLQSERMGHEVPGMRGVYSHITRRMRWARISACAFLLP